MLWMDVNSFSTTILFLLLSELMVAKDMLDNDLLQPNPHFDVSFERK